MGTVASDKDSERDASESSGYTDLMEIATALGIEDDEPGGREDEHGVVDDLEPLGTGYGGAAAAALISDASAETPAANAARPVESATIRREPPPPPPITRSSSTAVPAVAAAVPVPVAPAPTPVPSAAASTVAPARSSASLLDAPIAPVISAAPRPAPVAAPPQQSKGKGGIILVAAATVIALGAGLWYLSLRSAGNKHEVAENEVRVAAPATDPDAEAREAARLAAEKAAADKAAADKLAAEEAARLEAERLAAEEAARLEAERLAAEEAARLEAERLAAEAEVTVTQKKKGPKTGPTEPVAEDEPKAPPAKPEPLTPGEIDEKFRAECVLNPNKPGCDELRKKSRNTTDLDATLSDKLTQAQIREGFSSVKGKAKACGGEPGVTVRVKVSIEGDSGNVISAQALDDHAGTKLGDCVVDALKGASFPRFTSGQQGTVYPVSF